MEVQGRKEGPPREGDECMAVHVYAQMEGRFQQAVCLGVCLQVEVGQVYCS